MSHKFLFLVLTLCWSHSQSLKAEDTLPVLVKRDQRSLIAKTEFGEISAVDISDGSNGSYHLQFFALEPNSVFLPVRLHQDMVFYVISGSGSLSWSSEQNLKVINLMKGDVFMLNQGTVFYIENSLLKLGEQEKLMIFAMFLDTEENESDTGPYTSIRNLVCGFDNKILSAAFNVPQNVIESILNGTEQQSPIVQASPQNKIFQSEDQLIRMFLPKVSKKKKTKTYNIFTDSNPDFQNPYGWSITVDKKNLKQLKGTNIGLFMVNLTQGSMMGPHWNQIGTEVAMVVQGEGMVRVVCPGMAKHCENVRFQVGEGDVFAVSRFHPTAQMAFENRTFVFMGFRFGDGDGDLQFLGGKRSVFNGLDREVIGLSFNLSNVSAIDELVRQENSDVILECVLCAEEEMQAMGATHRQVWNA